MDCFYTIRISRNKLYEHYQKLFFHCVFVVYGCSKSFAARINKINFVYPSCKRYSNCQIQIFESHYFYAQLT